MSTVDLETVFGRIGNRLSLGWEEASESTDTETILARVTADTESRPSDYQDDVYPAARVRDWEVGNWRFVTMTVRVFNRSELHPWNMWDDGQLSDVDVKEASVSAVDSDSTGDYYATLISDLYTEATSPAQSHRHTPVAGMMYVDDEDLDSVARARGKVECERCDMVYRPGGGWHA